MLSKEIIKAYKLLNRVQKEARSYLKEIQTSGTPIKTLRVVVMEKFYLTEKKSAKNLAKAINVNFTEDKNLQTKVPSVTVADMINNNCFILLQETTNGSYLRIIWIGD